MRLEGGCYCGALRYQADAEPLMRGQCHCRECQYFSGGHPNVILGMPESSFRYTKGSPSTFARKDLQAPVKREFCATCGTSILSRAPGLPGAVLIKVGTFDDPSLFGAPQMVIYTCDKQAFHHIPSGVPTFEKVPGR